MCYDDDDNDDEGVPDARAAGNNSPTSNTKTNWFVRHTREAGTQGTRLRVSG